MAKTTPPFGLDPVMVLKNPDKFPRLLLRGIYDVMKREEKAGRGSLMERYRKGFNVVVFGLVKAKPPRLRVTPAGEIELIGFGWQRETDVHRGTEKKETDDKMKELYRWIKFLRSQLPEDAPKGDPTIRGGSKAQSGAPVGPGAQSGAGSPGVP